MQTTKPEAATVLRMQAERTGNGPPIVLIGGGLTGRAGWDPHVEPLAALRGQGEAWARRTANAPIMPRELAVESDYVFVPQRFAQVARFLVDGPDR